MIVIKDFLMPKNCFECLLYEEDLKFCIVGSQGCVDRYAYDPNEKPSWCPLIEVSDMNVEKCSEFPNSSNCISRQDAVEVADAIWTVTGDKNVAKVWQQLKDLPSVQPEIIQCKDCMFWNEGNCYCEDIAVRGLEYYVGDIYTEENDFCSYGKRE